MATLLRILLVSGSLLVAGYTAALLAQAYRFWVALEAVASARGASIDGTSFLHANWFTQPQPDYDRVLGRRGVFVVIGESCDPCHVAAETWTQVLTAVDQDVGMIIASAGTTQSQGLQSATTALGSRVRVLQIADSLTFRAGTGIKSIPMTIALRDGKVVAAVVGIPSRMALEAIVRLWRNPSSSNVFFERDPHTSPLITSPASTPLVLPAER
jgi:hypothetical protein